MSIKWGIKHRVLLLALAPAIVISLLLGSYFTSIRLEEITKAMNDKGSAIATRLASAGEYGLFARDTEALRRLARHSLTNEISSIAFYDKYGAEIASAGLLNEDIDQSLPKNPSTKVVISTNDKNQTYSFLAPITLPEVVIDSKKEDSIKDENAKATVIGWTCVELEQKSTRLQVLHVLLRSCIIVLIGLAASTLLALRLGHNVANPILKMAEAVKRLKNGELHTRVNSQAKWELAVLESGINTMARSLQDIHSKMQSNINKATADLRKTLKTIEIQNLELDLARKEAENATNVKSEFLASMSHELRTPLNGILGFIHLLGKTSLNENQDDYVQTIQKSATSLLAIINDILDFSKIEAGKLVLDLIKMDIRECIEDCLTLLAPGAHSKALEIVPFIYSDVPERIIADPLRIKQVITNLVGNAIKFTTTGSVVIRVMVENETNETITLCIKITDTGIGMSKKQQKELFNAFNQTNPNISRRFGGTGLGLVICKKLVEQMDGEIAMESNLNEGSTFWFTLIANKTFEDNEPANYNKLNGYRVLLLEQMPATELSTKHLLETWGLQVNSTDNTLQLYERLAEAASKSQPFHIVLLGINQPTSDYEFLKKITKEIHKKHNIPIGVLVNTTEAQIHQDIMELGVDLCLAKPITRKKLFKALSYTLTNELQIKRTYNHFLQQHVLAVDDNQANLKLVSVFLESLGVKVSQCSSGQDAINMTKENLFNLIFMDLNMPGISGVEATQAIRNPSNPNYQTPIVALTAHLLLSERHQIIESGFNDYLTKPIDENGLKACIYKWTHSGTRLPDLKISPIDWNMSLNLANGNADLAQEMLNMLIDGFDNDKINILESYENRDFKQLGEHVHKLHGACCYIGVPSLKSHAKELEEAIMIGAAEKIYGLNKMLLEEIDIIKEYFKTAQFQKNITKISEVAEI
jgi:two-component system sensor histidine kinase BarA